MLIDKTPKGKERPWESKKIKSLNIAESYKRLGINKKYYKVSECGSYLEFKQFKDNSMTLHQANFCKVRLCPMCAWRRSLKIYGQVSKVMNKVVQEQEYDFIFLTLTCRNIKGDELHQEIDSLYKAFDRLTKRSKYKKAIKGHFRALEVTHNLNKNSIWYDTYHPHFHVVLVVNKSYFVDKNYYISQEEWTSLWKNSLKVDYNPIVDVRRFKDKKGQGVASGVAEVAKYTVKDNDYVVEDENNVIDEKMTDNAVWILDGALANRRLTAFGGILKVIHKELNLDDTEDGDLINTDNEEELRDDLNYIIVRYNWNIGYNQYIMNS